MDADMRKRLQRLEDDLALRQHINQYHWFADTFQWDQWAQLLSTDHVFEVVSADRTYNGRAETVARCRHGLESRYEACQHAIVNLRFELGDENHAAGFGNIIFVGIPPKNEPNRNYQSGGRYRWNFVKDAGKWLTSRTRIEFIWESNDVAVSNFFTTPVEK